MGRVAVELERGELSIGFWQQMFLMAGKYLCKVRFSPGRVKLTGRDAPKASIENRDRMNKPIRLDGIWKLGPHKAIPKWPFVSYAWEDAKRALCLLIYHYGSR